MKTYKLVMLGGLALLVVAFAVAVSTPHWFATTQDANVAALAPDIRDPALIKQGEYLARAGDCAACHSAPGGRPFAGGLAMQTPMGTIYSTNITPHEKSGIGSYSYADFERAVRRGMRPDGTPLYPAMPYVSYVVAADRDIQGLYAYFMASVEPVEQGNQATTIPWPLNLRWPLAWWQLLFAQPRTFVADASVDASEQRGAYLVEGLAHCGACHTPRGVAFQEKAVRDGAKGTYLSGSVLEGWYAKNLRNEGTGLASWTEHQLVDFLRTGRTERTAAFGGMADVVTHSTQHLNADDLRSMARYLKQLPARAGRAESWSPKADTTTARLRAGDYSEPGATRYVEHCAACHRLDGRGAPRVFPALANNSIVFADDPSSLIQVTLAGGAMPRTPHDKMAFVMPGFDQLRNREVAEILNFIRNGWGNHCSLISESDVGRMRRLVADKPAHYVPEVKK